MCKTPILLTGLAAVWLGGCATELASQAKPLGNVDANSGNLIAYWLKHDRSGKPGIDTPVLVTEPYAVLVVWCEKERHFYVYDNVAKRTFGTADFDAFLAELARLPTGVAVQQLDTCTVSRSHDMPREQRERLMQTLAAGGRIWAIDAASGTDRTCECYCESSGFRYP